MKSTIEKYYLDFKSPAGTSRGILNQKETYYLHIEEDGKAFTGECAVFRGLSCDDVPEYEEILTKISEHISQGEIIRWDDLRRVPSIQFGLEQALLARENYHQSSSRIWNPLSPVLFPSAFTEGKEGIKTNGLIWMGGIDFMREQIKEKIENGFDCIKLKIGINWPEEHKILQDLRKEFKSTDLEIRVDANGGFKPDAALDILYQLAELEIHSIEQPIKAGQYDEMEELCQKTPVPIALDEELIGNVQLEQKSALLDKIKPQYIILKPSLVGGFHGSREWIDLAEERKIGWWVTSALESNIGLNAIAQWTYTLNNPMPQGLGTGGLFLNNIPGRLKMKKDELWFV